MSVILKTNDYDQWIDAKENDTDKLQKLLKPYPASDMLSRPVSRMVNSPGVDSPELIKEVSQEVSAK